MPFPFGAVIGAAGSLIGGLMANKSAEQQGRQEARALQKQARYTKKYNKNKIQWLVEDARKAGIHPLAALGSSVAGSFSQPPAVFGGSGGGNTGTAIGNAVEKFGGELASLQVENARTDLERRKLALESERLDLLAKAQSRTMIKDTTEATRSPWIRSKFLTIHPNSDTQSAQNAQDEGGEPAEWLQGLVNILSGEWDWSGAEEWKARQPKDKFGRYMIPGHPDWPK